MTRTTGTTAPGHANSADAIKHWIPPPPPPPVVVTPGTPHIAITKNPKEQSVPSGSTVTWTIVVTNDGAVTLTNVRVTDPEAPGCARTSAQIPALATMAPGASTTYQCTRENVTASLHERRDRRRHAADRPRRDRERLART